MNNIGEITVKCDNAELAELLAQAGIGAASDSEIVVETDQGSISVNSKLFRKPVQVEQIADYIKSLVKDEGLKLGDIRFFYTQKLVEYNGQEVVLTEKENELFNLLANSTAEVPAEDIMRKIWNYSDDVETTTLDTHLYRLRQKLAEIDLGEVIITTAGGYKFKGVE